MNLFDIVGINRDDRGDNLIVLTPSDHMLVPDFPACRKERLQHYRFTGDVACLAKMHSLLHREHPLIRNGLDLILSGDTGGAGFAVEK